MPVAKTVVMSPFAFSAFSPPAGAAEGSGQVYFHSASPSSMYDPEYEPPLYDASTHLLLVLESPPGKVYVNSQQIDPEQAEASSLQSTGYSVVKG